ADKQLIAWVNGATGYRQWASEPNQKSNSIHLEAGAEYYLEIVMKEGCCDDHLTVRWQMPNGEFEVPISAAHLVHWIEGIGVALEDGDVPRQRLQFSLNNAPAGATIDSDSGILRWHPDAQTAYGSYLLEVQVTDSGDAAQSATRQFRVAVVPPLVISAETRGNPNGLTLTFASPVETSLALDPGHYGIDHGIQILSATLLTPTHVRLETSPIPEGNVYTLTVKAVPDANNPGQMIAPDYQVRFLQTQGVITRQEFHNLGGTSVSDLTNSERFPDSPDVSVLAPSLETPVNVRDNYGVRFAGYLTPPTTGEYTFFVSSDDQSAFFLSTDESPANKALIAFEPAWNESRQWIMGVNQAPRIPAAHPPEFFAGALFIEGEDFDFDHGQSITDQPIGMNGAYAGGAYQGLGSAADAEIDWHETNPSNDQAVYRPSTAVEAGKPNGPAGHDRGEFDVQINHVVGWSDAGDWYNYTRVFPETARDYYVLARLSSGGAPIAADLSEVISGRGTENQTLTKLGEFRSPATGNWDVFAFVPLTDSSGNFVKLNFTGQRTLRFTTLPGNLDLDYLMFKPVVNGPADLEQLRPVNQSLPIHLEAGRKYYLEGLMKEGGGGDNFGVAWVKPGDPPLNNGDPPIPGRYLTGLPPTEPVTIVSQPQNQTAAEFGEATFSVVVNGTPPFDYQWYRDDVPLPGENGPSLALENVSPADHNRVFRVEIFNGISFLRSADATLSINADLQPPTIAAIEGSATLDRVKILFSEPIDPADALDIANYQIDGLTVTSARLLSDGRRVVLSTSAHTPGALYTLIVNRIRDVAAARNPVAAGTQASFHGFVFTSGFLRREIFTGFGGTRVADLRAHDGFPDSPNAVDYVTEFESPGAGLDEYGVRLSGFLTVPVTGEYVFYLCSDDEGILYLSTDESPANKLQIGLEPAWNPPRQWMNSLNQPTRGNPPSNVSGPIALETGRRYYVEALMKEGGGADHIEVAWQMPGNGIPQNGSPPISGANLGAYANPDDASITILRQPVAATVLDGESATFEVRAASSKQPRYYQWQRNDQNILGANSSSYTTPPAQLADSGAKFRCLISIPGATVVSEAVELTVSADQKPPALVAVEGNIGFDRIIVRFSEPVDAADATNAENYQLSGGLSVQEARLKPDGRTVELITSTQAEGQEYVLSVRGIRDVSAARNPVADGTNMRFRAWQPEEFVGPFPSWADVKRDYGAVGDGVADDTDALQKALDEFGASDRPMPNPARVLYIPAGTYRITRTLNYATRIGSSVVGEAPDTTILKWDGQDNGVMLWANGVTLARMGRLTFDGSGRAQSGINHKWDQQRLFSTTGNEYADMCFKDLQFGIKAGIAANDAEVAVLRCRFIRCSVMGISIESFNALDWWVWHSLFEDCAVAVGNTYGAGHIHVYDSLFRRSTVSDVAVGNTSYFSFRRNTSVQSKTFLTQGFTLNPCQYTIQDNIIIDPIDPSPISINSFGPILLLDNWIRVRPENESSPSIIAGQASVISIGNHFNAANPFQVDRLASVDDQIVPAAAMNFVEPALPGPLPNRHRRIFEVAPGATAEQIQAAVDQAALESGTRPVVHLPAADYFIDRTIFIPANSDIQLVGDGYEASTRLRWTGAGSGPVLRLAGPSKAALREFSIYAGDRARGIDLDNADQPGARVSMDQAYFVANQDGNLVVDRLDETDVTLHNSNHVSAGRNASVRVVGGPKRAAGLASNSRFALFGGSSADNYLSYDVAQGARVMVQDTWYEGQPPRFLKLTGSGSFTLNGATVAAADPGHQGTPGLEPAIELHDFHGDVALLNFLLPVRSSGITLSGDNTNLNLFFAGMASWPQPMTDNSPGARWAGIGNIIGEPGAWWTRAQDQGQWDAEFLRLMFAPLRNEKPRPIAPKIDGVTDARIFRLFIAQGTIGMQISGLNEAPVLDAIADLTVVEGQAVSIQAEAVDQDQPFQTLSFQLDGTVPVGAAIHSASGLFTWTPSEDQGPGEYVINVRVTDNGSPALNDTKSFKINVTELNTAPRIGVIGSITNRLLTAFVDIGVPGDPAVNGSTTMPGDGSFEVIAGGSDIWGNSDRFHFAYQEVTGDFDLRVQVESL
ncbi:MAG: PA14 domain-containing protein, partial [Verrucomicrobiota bacterium]